MTHFLNPNRDRRFSSKLVSLAASLAMLASGFAGATPALATGSTFYVSTTGVASGASGGSCASPSFVGTNEVPIQAAIDIAAQSNPATVAYDDVGFSGTYTSTTIVLCPGTWTLAHTLKVDANVVFAGSGYGSTIIDGNRAVRIFDIGNYDEASEPLDGSNRPIGFAARVEIKDVTLQKGKVEGNDVSGVGGAIRTFGRDSLKATRVFFRDNVATRGAAVGAYGTDGAGDLVGQHGGPTGDVIVEASAFTGNSATIGSTVEFARYQKDLVGAVVKNSSFYGNSSRGILNFVFSNGTSIGNSLVANNTLGMAALYGGATVNVRGNVIAQNDGASPCGDGLPIGSDSIATAACGDPRNSTTVTVSTWTAMKPLTLFKANQIPVQRFGLGSTVRGAWAVSEGCNGDDALGVARPTSGSCDAGPIQQPTTLTAAPALVTDLVYTNVGSNYTVATAPSNGTGREVSYQSGDPRSCVVDPTTGAFTAQYSGTCPVVWTIAGTATSEELVGTTSVSWTGFPRWSGSSGGFTPLYDESRGYSYFVNTSGAIDRLSSSGTFQSSWVKLTSVEPWASAISASGDLYVANWYGTIAKITPSGTVNASWQTIGSDISGIVVNAQGDVFVASCNSQSLSQITKITAGGTASKFADIPVESCASEMQMDSLGNLYLTDWYRSGLLRVSADGTDVDYFTNTLNAWTQQVAIAPNNDVYYALIGDGRSAIAKYSAAGVYTEEWLALPNSCEPYGIIPSNYGSLFVACAGVSKIIEVEIATKRYFDAYTADYSATFNQLKVNSLDQLLVTSNQGYVLRLNAAKQNQTALVATASPLTLGQSGSVTVTGGTTSSANIYATTTPDICSVSNAGAITTIALGDCVISVSRLGDLNHFSASASVTVAISSVVVTPPVVTPPVVTPPVVTPPVVTPPVDDKPKSPFAGVTIVQPGKVTTSVTLLEAKAVGVSKAIATPKTSVGAAPIVKTKVNQAMSITVGGFTKGKPLLACLISGKACLNIKLATAGSTGKFVVPAMKFSKAGTYVIAVKDGTASRFVKVQVQTANR